MNRNDIVVLGVTIAAVVIVPGLANGFLSQMGYPWVGSAVWAMGYGLGVVFIWYEWIRPLDITGPEGVGYEEDESAEE
ncbi:hypothetical protein [Haloarcula onubensis]|uniref:DUF3311 domain-containing protein n=1 Tax=Haloarcula onubensis TaxID=2950539 RepID=A0ABU2FRW6_9EURY|nr:hypothetical protein [Halomicroarcula sp. S3CR25-11]MDS0283022.1 hypothetical protein [Halomicroarcula sp. S3CR25-11]